MSGIKKVMPGWFDEERRLAELKKKNLPLERLNAVVDWEMFRPVLEEHFSQEAKGLGGRPRYDLVLMLKILLLQRYYNLSDGQVELQILDRLSFQLFLGLGLADKVPDEKTIWLFREHLGGDCGVEKLFVRFDAHLEGQGLMGKSGKIVDASFVEVPKQRNTREENAAIRAGETPPSLSKNPHVLRQKDLDARWTKKGNQAYYGYKNHVKVDQASKLIVMYAVTPANVHDSQVFVDLVETGDGVVYADSAYAGEELAQQLAAKEVISRVHERAYRGQELTEEQKANNREKSRIRARVEHVFGTISMVLREGFRIRTIGLLRAEVQIGLVNWVYNLVRYEQIVRLKRMATQATA